MADFWTGVRMLLGRPGAAIARAFYPGYSWCQRCRWPWALVRGHTTMISNTKGCFPLCEGCWRALETPAARLPYYSQMAARWEWADADWPLIEAAVLAEVDRG